MKAVLTGSAVSKESLTVAATRSVGTTSSLSEAVKEGAASLGSDQAEAQVMLLNNAKDVSQSLGISFNHISFAFQ